MAYRLNLELLVDQKTLYFIKEYQLNVPQLCIEALVSEISRQNDIRQITQISTPNQENEELRQALRRMRIEKERLLEQVMTR